MGIAFSSIEQLDELGLFAGTDINVLDIGSSNLYSATAADITDFLHKHVRENIPDLSEFASRIAKGSAYDTEHGGSNGAFVGELFEKAGMKYAAIDIADGYRTTILDLNNTPAPAHFVGAFDLVLNFGTTEHLLNQYNAFKVMHDATKVGGYIVNSLPGVGYSNHGYFTYTPRCFFDLAGYNEYEVIGFWFEGPGGSNDLYAPVRDYASYFPNLAHTLADRDRTEAGRKIAALDIPDVGILIVYRKVKARPFMGALEKSTSVGNVPSSVTSSYESLPGVREIQTSCRGTSSPEREDPIGLLAKGRAMANRLNLRGTSKHSGVSASNAVSAHDEIVVSEEAQKLREGFILENLNVDECMRFYKLVVDSNGYFPYDWEERILMLGLAREPMRADLSERLIVVRNFIANGVKAGSNQ